MSACFLVSQLGDPDREVPTKSEHSACGPLETGVAVKRGSRSVTACPDAAIRPSTPASSSVEGASEDMPEPVASCADKEINGSPDKNVLLSGRAERCFPTDTDRAGLSGIDDDIPQGPDRFRSRALTAPTIEMGASGC